MIKVAVAGAAGRMGRRLVKCVLEAEDMELSGALEFGGCPELGRDAGEIAGCGKCGTPVTSDISDFIEASDALIDFSTGPVVEHAESAADAGTACVIGTTALDEEQKAALAKLAESGARIVFAPNMSVGVNLLFKLSGQVAEILGAEYDIEVVEMHHRRKKDAPSGTASRLGEILSEARGLSYSDDAVHGRSGMVGERKAGEIGMHALRGGDVVGDHTVIFASEGERLELTHKASSRDTFALGAMRGVRFLMKAEPGLYDMQDVLGL